MNSDAASATRAVISFHAVTAATAVAPAPMIMIVPIAVAVAPAPPIAVAVIAAAVIIIVIVVIVVIAVIGIGFGFVEPEDHRRDIAADGAQTEQLLEEVAGLSDKISLTVHELASAAEEAASYNIDRVPAFVVKGAARGQIRFFGIPSGYEFSSFIGDLLDASTGTTGLSEETRGYLTSLNENINIKVFTTPS